MRSKQSILSIVYTGGEIRRPPLIGMQFLHESAVRPDDVVAPRSRLQAKDLISLLVRHFAARRRAALPPCLACPDAKRETCGPDSFQVARRFRRRSPGSSP